MGEKITPHLSGQKKKMEEKSLKTEYGKHYQLTLNKERK